MATDPAASGASAATPADAPAPAAQATAGTRAALARFVILERAVDGDTAWLTWDLEYRLKPGQPVRRIHGASQLRFDGDGCVCHHRDYWDAAGELYETLPLLGSVLRLIRGRLRAR
jgi:hypothetical protein